MIDEVGITFKIRMDLDEDLDEDAVEAESLQTFPEGKKQLFDGLVVICIKEEVEQHVWQSRGLKGLQILVQMPSNSYPVSPI